MKRIITTLALSFAIAVGAVAQTLNVDTENAEVTFKVVSEDVTGTISGMDASITFSADDLGSAKIKGSIDVSTISTGIKKRDEHLQAEEYFHTDEYPTMEFESDQIDKTDKGFLMTGKLTIKGVTKDIRINFTFEDDTFVGKCVIYTNDFEFAETKKRDDSKIMIKFNVPVK